LLPKLVFDSETITQVFRWILERIVQMQVDAALGKPTAVANEEKRNRI
jgi:hypothetical protein